MDKKTEEVKERQEAPKQVELTEEQKIEHQRAVIISEIGKNEEVMNKLVEEVTAKGQHKMVYNRDTMVEIPGDLFAHILNSFAAAKAHNDNIVRMLAGITDAANAATLTAIDMQVVLTNKHVEFCEAGLTATLDEVDEHEAKETIKEPVPEKKAPAKKSKPKKADLKVVK